MRTDQRTRRTVAVKRLTVVAGLLLAVSSMDVSAAELEEVVVTARRWSTSLQEAPVSVSALSGQTLDSSRSHDIADWFGRVPGLVYADDGWGGHRTILRGITSGATFEPRPLSAWYLDDVPMMTQSGNVTSVGAIGAPHPYAVDLARIEVLRGPQGTLFGASALGGIVRQITNLPELDSYDGWMAAGFSSTDHGGTNGEVSAALNVPIAAQRAALRLVGYHHANEGFIDNVARSIDDIDESETTGGRLSLLWRVAPNLDMVLRVFGQKRAIEAISTTDVAAGAYEQIRLVPEQDSETWEVYSLSVDWELPRVQLTSVTSYIDRQPRLTFDGTNGTEPYLGFVFPTGNDYNDGIREFVQEIRATSAAGDRLSWVAGGYYDTVDRATHQQWISPGFDEATGGAAVSYGYPDSPWHADYYSYFRQRALFGEMTYELSPVWRIAAGARWFEFTERLDQYVSGLIVEGQDEAHGNYRESGVTPRLGIEFRPSDFAFVYFNAAQGFRPGGVNEITAANLEACQQDLDELGLDFAPSFKSDSLWNFELGARTRWLDDRLEMSVALYHIDWKDMQTLQILPTCGYGIVGNAGGAASRGTELELTWLANDSLTVALTAAYVDARIDEDVPTLAAEAGQRIPTVPQWSASARLRQEIGVASEITAFWQAEIQYGGETWNSWNRSRRVEVDSRDVVHLRAGASFGRWELEVFAENAFDERGVLFDNRDFLGEWQSLIRPRTVGMRARVRF
jgi:outer membrane receptor protein involved in Fe transport